MAGAPADFEASLAGRASGTWTHLKECPECKQLWRVDVPDKYQTQFALKVASPEGWEDIDTTAMVKELLLKTRGGTTNEVCIWSGCDGSRVKGVVYCIDHLYETGARE